MMVEESKILKSRGRRNSLKTLLYGVSFTKYETGKIEIKSRKKFPFI